MEITLIKWFIHRADRVYSNDDLFSKEIDSLGKIFYRNGFFNKCLQDYTTKRSVSCTAADHTHGEDASQVHDEKEFPCRVVLRVSYIGRPPSLYAKRLKTVMGKVTEDKLSVMYSTTKIGDYFRLNDI